MPYHLIKLLDVTMCEVCRFNRTAVVQGEDGRQTERMYCGRLDCDNFDTLSGKTPIEVIETKDNSRRP